MKLTTQGAPQACPILNFLTIILCQGVQEVIGSGWETPKGKAPKSPRKPKEAKPKKGKKGALEAENSSQEIPPLVNLGPEVYEFKDAPIEQTDKSKKPR